MIFDIIFLIFEIGFACYLVWESRFIRADSKALHDDLVELSKRLELIIESIEPAQEDKPRLQPISTIQSDVGIIRIVESAKL